MKSLAEFKEKTFEKYFGFELAQLTNISFSPDQCDEAFLGFDDAFFIPLELLWHRLPRMRRSRRLRLFGMDLRDLDFIAEELGRRLPPFKFNLFVQYKRPEYVDHHRGKEWPCWNGAYYRYDTTPHQQTILEKLETQSSGRASTVYATAAFWENKTLYDLSLSRGVIDHTNIASVGRLKGHHRFTYQFEGCTGKGHSQAESIETPKFSQIIADGLNQEALPFNRHIKRCARQIEDVLKEDDATMTLIGAARRNLLRYEETSTPDSFSYALATISVFREIFDTSFYAVG